MTEILQMSPRVATRVLGDRDAETLSTVRAQLAEAKRLQDEQGLSQAAAYAAVGLLVAAGQISSDQA